MSARSRQWRMARRVARRGGVDYVAMPRERANAGARTQQHMAAGARARVEQQRARKSGEVRCAR